MNFQKINRVLGVDAEYLVSGGFWLSVGHMIQVLSGLVIAISFANLLDKSTFGIYQMIMTLATVLGAFTLNLKIPLRNAVSRGHDGALISAFKKQLHWSVLILVVSVMMAGYYYFNENLVLCKALLIVGIFSPLIGSFGLYKHFLIGKKHFKESALYGIFLRPVLVIVLLSILVFTQNVLILITAYFLTSTLTIGYLYLRVVTKYKITEESIDKFVNYGKHLSILGVIATISKHIEKLVIFYFLGATQLAIYFIALLPVTHLLRLYTVAGDLILPKFVKHSFKIVKQNVTRKLLIVFVSTLLLAVTYIALSPILYKVVFPNYPESISLTQIAALSLLTKFATVFNQSFHAFEMKQEQYISRISTFIVKLVLLVFLIPTLGVMGAVITTVAANLFWCLLSTILFFRKRPV